MVSALGGVVDLSEEEAAKALENIPDPAGSFYRYSLSASLLGSKRKEGGK